MTEDLNKLQELKKSQESGFFSKVTELVRQIIRPKVVATITTQEELTAKTLALKKVYAQALKDHEANDKALDALIESDNLAKLERQNLQQKVQAQDPKMEGAGGLEDPVMAALKAQGRINRPGVAAVQSRQAHQRAEAAQQKLTKGSSVSNGVGVAPSSTISANKSRGTSNEL